MNSSNKTAAALVLAILSIVIAAVSNAQGGKEKPEPPFVAAMPGFLAWTMTFGHESKHGKPGKTHPPPLTILKVVSTKTKNIKRDVIFYSNGNSTEVWYYDDRVIVRSANGEFAIGAAGDAALGVPDVSAQGFFGVDWISAENFQKKEKLQSGEDVYVYNATVPRQEAEIPAKAMISVDTRFPLVVKKDARTITYSYQTPPKEMLALPADLQKQLASIQQREDFARKLKSLSSH